MKNPPQSLLIVFAVGLCGLCTWQWYGQVLQQKQLNALAQINYDQTVAIQGYTNSINTMDHQIAQMDTRITELRDSIGSNNAVIFALRADNSRLTSLADQYSNAVVVLDGRVKQANDSIRRQNEAVKSLGQERDEYVNRLNEDIKERNDIVAKYNALVKQIEAIQAAQSKKQSPP
jgi:peptidoglycan hydrolase CwlO-like protein